MEIQCNKTPFLHILAGWIWLGGTDVSNEGSFVWQHSGKPVTFTSWAPPLQPDNDNDEDYIALSDVDQYQWYDTHTVPAKNVLCEKDPIFVG